MSVPFSIRPTPAATSLLITALIGYALLTGFGAPLPVTVSEALKLFEVTPAPPPLVQLVPHPKKSKRPEGAASPPNLRAKATEIVAPPLIIVPRIPPPIVAAIKPATGTAAASGASNIVGPGTGSGGIGNGTGSGGAGDGDGDGGDETPPRLRKGRLKNSDYPRSAGEAGVSGTVGVRYLVETDGRVTECVVTRSSGNAELDATTCRLIRERFRFEPSRDAKGTPVPAYLVEKHSWFIRPGTETPPDER